MTRFANSPIAISNPHCRRAISSCFWLRRPGGRKRMRITDLELTEFARHIAAGEISACDAAQACLDALETVGRKLNCTVATYRDEAMAVAEAADRDRARGVIRGPLHGVPLAHKDLFDVEGR